MKYILRRRPSPALVISCIALFVSLGGVSYGVATGFIDSREIRNNTIASGDVRNNTLRTFDIRNNEVRGFDIRNSLVQGRDVAFNTLTGADINESSLGKVPAAAAGRQRDRRRWPSVQTFAPTTVAEGAAPVTLVTHGPLTLSAACVDVREHRGRCASRPRRRIGGQRPRRSTRRRASSELLDGATRARRDHRSPGAGGGDHG